MVLKEKMNPLGLDVSRFLVAEDSVSGKVKGFGQLVEWPCLYHQLDWRGVAVRALNLKPNWEVSNLGVHHPIQACIDSDFAITNTLKETSPEDPRVQRVGLDDTNDVPLEGYLQGSSLGLQIFENHNNRLLHRSIICTTGIFGCVCLASLSRRYLGYQVRSRHVAAETFVSKVLLNVRRLERF